MSEEVVIVFGDSVAMGLWDERGGWPERLWDGHSRIVYNLGVDGNTSEDVKNRFSLEAKSRGANKNSVIIFAVGINDSSRMNGENRVKLAKYMSNMERLIDQAKGQFTEKILCVGLTRIDESKTDPFILEKTISFFAADQNAYDSALRTVCDRKGVSYVSLKNLKLENHLSDDGVHPLSSGHAIIAKRVLEALNQRA
ncbi:MAG TPA: GDSL-type esterase/lipase family protein [Candidatus Bathyarchaeia archaeon]|nr:GDSL-type esterase/lipase family protein [Candidatus Bathyarchaeia archaeon]